jgi:hypothetical protein
VHFRLEWSKSFVPSSLPWRRKQRNKCMQIIYSRVARHSHMGTSHRPNKSHAQTNPSKALTSHIANKQHLLQGTSTVPAYQGIPKLSVQPCRAIGLAGVADRPQIWVHFHDLRSGSQTTHPERGKHPRRKSGRGTDNLNLTAAAFDARARCHNGQFDVVERRCIAGTQMCRSPGRLATEELW